MALGPKKPGNSDKKPTTDSNASDDLFIREVDEALREDEMGEFIRKYGVLIGIAMLLGLAGLGGWIYYQHHQKEQSQLLGEEYVQALDALKANNPKGADKVLDKLDDASQPGYRAAAGLLKAAIAMEQNQDKKAEKAYADIAADSSLPQEYRDLALIRRTALQYDTLKPKEVISRLKHLAVPGNPWFGSAGEMVAIAHLQLNQRDLAGAMFAQLAKDKNVPESIKGRASQMAGVMGVDTVDDPEKVSSFGQQGVGSAGPAPSAAAPPQGAPQAGGPDSQ